MKNTHNDLWIEGGNNRRQFLKLAGYGTLGLMTGGVWPLLGQSAAEQPGARRHGHDAQLLCQRCIKRQL
jgi:hypothetical protein